MTWKPSTIAFFVLPALAVYGLFVIYPTFSGLLLSLTDSKGVGQGQFIGLANYARMLEDSQVRTALLNTVIYTVLVTFFQNALGLGLAVWLGNMPELRNSLRVVFLLPSMLSMLVVGFIWSYLFSPLGGPINEMLQALGLGSLKRVWLGDPGIALFSIVGVHVWMYLGHSTAIFLAGYLGLPSELRDSAAIDGATGWVRFWRVEWPLLAPATTVAVTLTLLGSSKTFELPFVLTRGGPGDATMLSSLTVFQNAFAGERFGYATAIALVTLVGVVIISNVVSSALRRREQLI